VAQKEFRQIYPQPGWVEHDPEEVWSTQLAVARAALRKARITAGDIAGIGVTNQRETTVLWDARTGKPVHNAIVWQDRRTAGLCRQLQQGSHAAAFTERTGLVIDAYFSGTKIAWLLKHVPEAEQLAKSGQLRFGTIDTWLLWKLTGGNVHVTDTTNASRTLLFDIQRLEWDDELLGALKVPRTLLPDVRSSSEVYGETARALLGRPVPIAGIAGDQQAALFGQMCHKPGLIKNTYGTGCFLLMNVGPAPRASANRLLTTVAATVGNTTDYALEGSVFIGGAVVQWLRDGLKLIKSSAQVEALAATVPDNGGVYVVPAFAGLGAPHWDPEARGSISGLTRGSNGGHIARAALESIAYQVADVVDAMRADSGVKPAALRVDGGAAANNLLMQFQADILQVPVVRPKIQETTALGAAYLAGLATGVWKSRAELAGQWQQDRCFEPTMPKAAVQRLRGEWSRAVERARGWAGGGS
jgi:glycerol kinase